VLIRSEFRKLATIRGPWLLLACGPVIVIGGVTGLVVSGGNVHDQSVQNAALAHVTLAGLLTLIFGILAVAGEYRHRTITDTYLSDPARGRVLAAKLVVHAAVGAVAGLVSAGAAVATTAIWWSAEGGTLHLGDAWRTIVGGAAVNLAFAVIGVGVGALVRNLVAAVAAALAWIAVIEGIAGQLVGSGLARWLPFAAGAALGRTSTSTSALPQWAGGLVLLGYTAAFAVAALLTTLERDVT
jgi:ABC-2 type transport system permease protein